ncbi:MAG: ElyC/SanA/YdcF family protein, partial [bacterium]
YVRNCLPALLAAIKTLGDTQIDFRLEIIKLATKGCNEDSVIPLMPMDMDALIKELIKVGLVKEADAAISKNKLLRKHKAYFYRVNQAKVGNLWRGAFAKTGPILVTQKDGVVVPAIGDFYLVSRAKQTRGKIYLDIRRLSDDEIQQRYGLVKLKDAAGYPYELEFSSLRDVVGRLSMFPGNFGWTQIVSTLRGEEPLLRPADLFIPVITGEELAFQPARLEIKGLGTAKIKSLHNVFDESGRPIQVMENQASQPNPRIKFRLFDEHDRFISGDINHFLKLPGLLSGTNYQPYFNSPPGLEEANQSQRDGNNEPRVCQNGVTLPNHFIFHWWFKDRLSETDRSYGITLRLAKSDSRALRLRELLYEYEQFGQDSRLAKWKTEGKVFDMLKNFLYRVGLNLAGMNQSRLYLFPNGDKRVNETSDSYGAVVREIYGRSVGSLMKAEPAYNMVLNNYCFNGDLADLGEYVDGPGTSDFAIAYLLHFMARLVREFKEKGIITSQEADDPRLLEAYLTGVSRLVPGDTKYAELNLKFPDPEIFRLTQERFSKADYGGNSESEMANYRINITDLRLSRILSEIKTSDFAGRNLSSSEPREAKIIQVCRECYYLFKAWDEYVLKILDYPIAGQILTQKVLRACLDYCWNRHKLVQSQDAYEFKELFLALQTAFTYQTAVVEYSGQTITLEQAIERFNTLVKILRHDKIVSSPVAKNVITNSTKLYSEGKLGLAKEVIAKLIFQRLADVKAKADALIDQWDSALDVSHLPPGVQTTKVTVTSYRGEEESNSFTLTIPKEEYFNEKTFPELAGYLAVYINNVAHSIGASTVYIDGLSPKLFNRVVRTFEDMFNQLTRNGNADSVSFYLSEYFNKVFEIKRGRLDEQISIRQKSLGIAGIKKGVYVGIDIGGTEIKVTVLSDGEDLTAQFNTKELHKIRRAATEAYQDKNAFVPSDNFTYEGFISTVEELIRKVLKKLEIEVNDVKAIGFSWAGAVRDNKVAGSSKIPLAMQGAAVNYGHFNEYISIMKLVQGNMRLKKFFKIGWEDEIPGNPGKMEVKKGLYKKDIQTIAEGRLFNVNGLNKSLVERVTKLGQALYFEKSEIRKKVDVFHRDIAERLRKSPLLPAFLINDGDADLVRLHIENPETTEIMIIKLGTSLAGGYITQEGNIQGLNEFGRIVLNFSEQAKKNIFTKIKGLAAPYISSITVVNLAKEKELIAAILKEKNRIEKDIADGEVTREKYNQSVYYKIRALSKEEDVDDKLKFDSKEVGMLLATDLFPQSTKIAKSIFKELARNIAVMAIHVGKFYSAKNVLLAGGVLNGETGQLIKKEVERALKEQSEVDMTIYMTKSKQVGETLEEQDAYRRAFEGALGAAYYAAIKVNADDEGALDKGKERKERDGVNLITYKGSETSSPLTQKNFPVYAKEIDLPEVAFKIKVELKVGSSSLDDLEKRLVLQEVLNFLAVQDKLKKADLLIVLGSPDLVVPEKVAEIYHQKYADHVIISGKKGRWNQDWVKTEAERYKDIMIGKDVPESAFLPLDKEATNTGANIQNTIRILKKEEVKPQKVILMQTPVLQRRAWANFVKDFQEERAYFGKVECVNYTPYIPDVKEMRAEEFKLTLGHAWDEIERLVVYSSNGWIDKDISRVPEDLLIKSAYTSFTPKDAEEKIMKLKEKLQSQESGSPLTQKNFPATAKEIGLPEAVFEELKLADDRGKDETDRLSISPIEILVGLAGLGLGNGEGRYEFYYPFGKKGDRHLLDKEKSSSPLLENIVDQSGNRLAVILRKDQEGLFDEVDVPFSIEAKRLAAGQRYIEVAEDIKHIVIIDEGNIILNMDRFIQNSIDLTQSRIAALYTSYQLTNNGKEDASVTVFKTRPASKQIDLKSDTLAEILKLQDKVNVIRENGLLRAVIPLLGWDYPQMKPLLNPNHPLGMGIKTPRLEPRGIGEFLHLEMPFIAMNWGQASRNDRPMYDMFILLEGESQALFADKQGRNEQEVIINAGDKIINFAAHRFRFPYGDNNRVVVIAEGPFNTGIQGTPHLIFVVTTTSTVR